MNNCCNSYEAGRVCGGFNGRNVMGWEQVRQKGWRRNSRKALHVSAFHSMFSHQAVDREDRKGIRYAHSVSTSLAKDCPHMGSFSGNELTGG